MRASRIRANRSGPAGLFAACSRWSIQPIKSPFGNVANEQVQGIGELVQVAVTQVMGRQRTARNVIGLGAGLPELGVAAAMEMPVGLELGASGLGSFG